MSLINVENIKIKIERINQSVETTHYVTHLYEFHVGRTSESQPNARGGEKTAVLCRTFVGRK